MNKTFKKLFSFFLEILSFGSPRAIVINISTILLLLIIILVVIFKNYEKLTFVQRQNEIQREYQAARLRQHQGWPLWLGKTFNF